jgi:hypothetical protein
MPASTRLGVTWGDRRRSRSPKRVGGGGLERWGLVDEPLACPTELIAGYRRAVDAVPPQFLDGH